MSSRSCPDWPELMELAPELQFKHFTVSEARLPADALMLVTDVGLGDVAICCDLETTSSTRSTPIRAWPTRCGPATGSRCATGSRRGAPARPRPA